MLTSASSGGSSVEPELFELVRIRLADALTSAERPLVDEAFYADLAAHFSDDQILDLGMCSAFALGWQRFIEAFGIVPDQWRDGSRLPWRI